VVKLGQHRDGAAIGECLGDPHVALDRFDAPGREWQRLSCEVTLQKIRFIPSDGAHDWVFLIHAAARDSDSV
jgi:hypothetical protein